MRQMKKAKEVRFRGKFLLILGMPSVEKPSVSQSSL